MPYVIAAAIGLALLVLFQIPVLLGLCAWGVWAARGYDRALAILGLATIVMADDERITAVMWLTLGLGFPLILSALCLHMGCARVPPFGLGLGPLRSAFLPLCFPRSL